MKLPHLSVGNCLSKSPFGFATKRWGKSLKNRQELVLLFYHNYKHKSLGSVTRMPILGRVCHSMVQPALETPVGGHGVVTHLGLQARLRVVDQLDLLKWKYI